MSNSPNETISSSSRMLRAWYACFSPGGGSALVNARWNCSHAPGLSRRAVIITIIGDLRIGLSAAGDPMRTSAPQQPTDRAHQLVDLLGRALGRGRAA